ncbi:ethanolamine-phosphate cytidylyltransferase-like [Condylostylus longicornis]|uniref:ethanolamine-phosphate cytidylyltransferase-like n=1 Tax=Condylostylus longicornis TaxID=2530218 RepID=UPI00244DA120|nr:ethanolamine-phosphate cytidylyltransferase-like [Condylostylus longicornis]
MYPSGSYAKPYPALILSQSIYTFLVYKEIWCDGCYDLVHFGHANSFRQAKLLANKLIVGVHSDNEVLKHKRLPIYTEEERYKLIKGIKWVDEVVEDSPYVTTIDVLDKYNCYYCAHGNDITATFDGIDTYKIIKETNRYKELKRTPGISTTAIINRILEKYQEKNKSTITLENNGILFEEETNNKHSKWTGINDPFLMTTSKIFEFMNNEYRTPKSNDKIIYAPGSYDLFHIGHLDFLENCKNESDYLIVGLYTDEIIKKIKNSQYPIMNLQERIFNVLSYKCVDEVIIGAPYIISEDFINQIKIDTIYHGGKHLIFANDYVRGIRNNGKQTEN